MTPMARPKAAFCSGDLHHWYIDACSTHQCTAFVSAQRHGIYVACEHCVGSGRRLIPEETLDVRVVPERLLHHGDASTARVAV